MADSSPLRGYTAFAQFGSDELFTNQPDQQPDQHSGAASVRNESLLQPGEEFDFGQFSNHDYLGNPVGFSNPNQVHGNLGTYSQPQPLYDIRNGNFAPPYEGTLFGSAHQPGYDNTMVGPQGHWPLTYGPGIATSNDLFPGSVMPQSAIGAALELEAVIDNHWLTDSSLFLPPGWDAAIPTDQPSHAPVGSVELFGLAEQTWATPFLHAGAQQVAGDPGAYLPIGDQNTLAHARLSSIEEAPGPLAYSCLHAGCRKPFFKRLGDLERHQNNAHNQTEFFWCRHDECGRGKPFPRKYKRNEHERKIHHIDYTIAENH